MSSHLVLIGFKHVGKSLLGENLSTRLERPFVDLDAELVRLHAKHCGQEESCREILHKHGDAFFRDLESEALSKILEGEVPLILALGGGTPLVERNQLLLQGHELVHVAAPRSVVFERIMINGKPAFFSPEGDAFDQFQELWAERIPVFERLAKITVKNEGSIDALTDEVLAHLNLPQ